jgi:hypothetical protein
MFEGILSSPEFWDTISLASLGILAITAVAIAVSTVKNKLRKRRVGFEPTISIPTKHKETSKTRRIFPSSNTPEPELEPEVAEKDVEPAISESADEPACEPVNEPVSKSIGGASEKPRPIMGHLDKEGNIRFGDKALVRLTLPFGEMSVEDSELAREIVDKVLARADSERIK